MRSSTGARDHVHMDHAQRTDTVQLVIEVRTGSDPIEGRLIEPEASATTFRGWLLLASLIDSARAHVLCDSSETLSAGRTPVTEPTTRT